MTDLRAPELTTPSTEAEDVPSDVRNFVWSRYVKTDPDLDKDPTESEMLEFAAACIMADRASRPAPIPNAERLRDLDYLIDDVVADAYVRGVEGLSTEVSPQSAKTLHDAIADALAQPAAAVMPDMLGGQRRSHWPELAVALRRIHSNGAVTSELREAAQVLDALSALNLIPAATAQPDEEALTVAKDAGADFVLEHLGKALGFEGWDQKDGTEEWEGDVLATLYGILHGAKVLDDDNHRVPATARAVGGEPVSPAVAELVVAARIVAFEDQSQPALDRLDRASEAFAELVPWDDAPEDKPARATLVEQLRAIAVLANGLLKPDERAALLQSLASPPAATEGHR